MSQGFPGQNPYHDFGSRGFQPPQKNSSGANKLLIILGVAGGGLFLLCCGGLCGLAMFGFNVTEAEVAAQLRDHPVVRERLGEIQSLETNFTESFAEEDEDTFIYEVQGDKGSGKLTVITDMADNITFAELRMSDGEKIVLVNDAKTIEQE